MIQDEAGARRDRGRGEVDDCGNGLGGGGERRLEPPLKGLGVKQDTGGTAIQRL
jgi:hypothetical protein